MNFHQDDLLIRQAQSGEEDAFNALYRKYYKTMLYTAFRFTNNIEDAKDAVQSAFMQMYQSIGNLKDPKYFRLWMNKIVRGKCIDMFHKNKDSVIDTSKEEIINTFAEEREEYVPHEKLKYTADQDIVVHLMKELPAHYQEVLFYAYYSQFSMKEIADILEIPEGTVKSRLYAAKKSLRDKIMDYEGMYQYKITFRMSGLSSFCLFLALHKHAKCCVGIQTNQRMVKFKSSPKVTMTFAGVLSCAIVVGSLQQIYQDNEESANTSLPNSGGYNEQEAYFRLRNWAMDEVQMSEKSKEEIAEITVYYEFLKQQKGPYWERMQKDEWDRAFEDLRK